LKRHQRAFKHTALQAQLSTIMTRFGQFLFFKQANFFWKDNPTIKQSISKEKNSTAEDGLE